LRHVVVGHLLLRSERKQRLLQERLLVRVEGGLHAVSIVRPSEALVPVEAHRVGTVACLVHGGPDHGPSSSVVEEAPPRVSKGVQVARGLAEGLVRVEGRSSHIVVVLKSHWALTQPEGVDVIEPSEASSLVHHLVRVVVHKALT
jgi:hypothetical protein